MIWCRSPARPANTRLWPSEDQSGWMCSPVRPWPPRAGLCRPVARGRPRCRRTGHLSGGSSGKPPMVSLATRRPEMRRTPRRIDRSQRRSRAWHSSWAKPSAEAARFMASPLSSPGSRVTPACRKKLARRRKAGRRPWWPGAARGKLASARRQRNGGWWISAFSARSRFGRTATGFGSGAGGSSARCSPYCSSTLTRSSRRDRLIDVLWGEKPPPTASHTLDAYLSRLRKALASDGDGEVRLVTLAPGYAAADRTPSAPPLRPLQAAGGRRPACARRGGTGARQPPSCGKRRRSGTACRLLTLSSSRSRGRRAAAGAAVRR